MYIKQYSFNLLKGFLIGSLLFFLSCTNKSELNHIVGKTMGTTYSVKYFSNSKSEKREKISKRISELLIEVNRQMSTYQKDSEITYFNKQSRQGWTKISDDFLYVLNFSLELAKATQGIFDPTIGPLVNLWGFGPDGNRKVPSDTLIEQTRKTIGFEKIAIDLNNKKIKKDIGDVYLDLSATAKGFGVDKISDYLLTMGIQNFLVEIGGEVRASGTKNGDHWSIGISSPDMQSKEPIQKVLKLKDYSVATSGDYRNFFMDGGKKYSHTINYKTGKPVVNSLASVTIIDEKSCMKADGVATAVMAMGFKNGYEYALKNNIAAYFIYRTNLDNGQSTQSFVTKVTPKFESLVGVKND